MGKRNRAALLPTHLPQLQNLIKRDPKSYEAEFLQQYRHFQSTLSIFVMKPDEDAKELAELITFISQVSVCYPKETAQFPQHIVDLLQEHCLVLNPELRRSLVQALILLRNRNVLDNTKLLPLFFTLFKCKDKALRELLYNHIVTDIKNANAKAKNNKLNKTLQSFMFTILESAKTGSSDENAVAAKKSVDICVDLYQKNIWNDSKTVNVIAEACFSPVTKISVTAVKFFLNTNEDKEESEDDDDDEADLKKMQMAQVHTKKTKAKARKIDLAKKKIKRKGKSQKAESFNFSALHLLNDPQGFAEKLYSRLASKEDRWEVRIMKMNLVSRVIGIHQLTILGFYPLLIKYLQPSQRDVTMVLVCTAQATHSLVPPDVLEPVLKAIANNFVTDRTSNEVMAVGINGIREICSRQPLAIDTALLQDLTQYKNHREKSVMMAARSLITLFREINPEMLMKKDRGKSATVRLKDGSVKVVHYGETSDGLVGLQGVELLDENAAEEKEDDGWDEWEVDEDSDSDDSDGWINVPSDNEDEFDIDMGDEDDKEKPTAEEDGKPKRRIGKRQLRKLQDLEKDEPLTEEQQKKLVEEMEIRRAEQQKKQEAVLKMATTRILTPADFAKLEELRQAKEDGTTTTKKRSAATDEKDDGQVDEYAILGPRKKMKQDYEARMASIQEGREGREKFGSKKGNKDRGSTTNREKARNKNFQMVSQKNSVLWKSKRSLFDKQKSLRAAITKQKKRKH
ncbi:SDA1-domain-containing protein [Halteromyces radiatus]|uniref:SDA1-domain-containing protein n=1 Tax=Halteromyces radiatus TaxID=101107 RepID=UPI00221E7155|nr:SDA1-domain-containing protein [Halteromyces radiatus]KAI8086691.1 SDA1-domain-containing protein [Halteromyces radiatus]